jgi:hypothetical protein
MDKRSPSQKWLWDNVGAPLYYCADCLLEVKVKIVEGGEPIIKRPCDCEAQIIAPRKAVCMGEGNAIHKAPFPVMREIIKQRVIAMLTRRCG